MIYYHTPYHVGGNLGKYYNDVCSGLKPGDHVCFTDRDTWFPYPRYGDIIANCVDRGFDLLTCYTNRVARDFQTINKRFWNVEPANAHTTIAADLAKQHGDMIVDVTDEEYTPSGMLLLLSCESWKHYGPFKEEGILYVDTDFGNRVKNQGGRIGLMTGVYVWHYYRNGNIYDQRHLDVK